MTEAPPKSAAPRATPKSRSPVDSLRALAPILPFARKRKAWALSAPGALTVASAATLAMPLAVRGMIDRGFAADHAAVVNSYFLALIGVVGLLAAASAVRYFLVMTLGERIVADLRDDVFTHLTRLDPAFFDSAQTGELVSRLTADTTQIKSTFGSSASIALRNLFLFIGAIGLMVYTSAKLSGLVADRDSDRRAAAVRLRTLGARAFARRAGHARRSQRFRRGKPRRGADHAGLRRRKNHPRTFAGMRRKGPIRPPARRPRRGRS